ncbi:hypothetical protein ACJX0J_023071, partial [Zea mays]
MSTSVAILVALQYIYMNINYFITFPNTLSCMESFFLFSFWLRLFCQLMLNSLVADHVIFLFTIYQWIGTGLAMYTTIRGGDATT